MQHLKRITNSKTQTLIDELCEKLHCSELANDLERINHAREMLAKLQETEVFKNICSNDKTFKPTNIQTMNSSKTIISPSSSKSMGSDKISLHAFDTMGAGAEEEYEYEWMKNVKCEEKSNDAWLGYFQGYDILEEKHKYILSENKQCILLSLDDDNSSLESYLRAGIRCFMIDLFTATGLENQKIIFNLHETELKISKEYGFPITTTLVAMLSPRLQYTGIMDDKNPTENLFKNDELLLTTKRKFASKSNCHRVYVNARFLIDDCKMGDYILIGPNIQLSVLEVLDKELKCKVMEPGLLKSRLPVRFPGRCDRYQLSLEELEDITFAREVGITILVSYIADTPQYVNDLYDALSLLKCENLCLFARIVLNDLKKKTKDFDWIAQHYDGFLIELTTEQQSNLHVYSDDKTISLLPDLLRLPPCANSFLTKVYNMKKPIILNPLPIAERQLYVQPHDVRQIFYYPDKYIFSRTCLDKSFFFYLLQNAMNDIVLRMELPHQLYCDQSELGDDSIARACVAASFESQAKAIIVYSSMPDMAIKLSHFRPKVPIVQISATKSIGNYISVYHNIEFLNFHTHAQYNYKEFVIKAFTFSLIYLKSRYTLKTKDNVIFVYGTEVDSKFCDNYLIYKFDKHKLTNNLAKVLFT